jgi:hypothetical protein
MSAAERLADIRARADAAEGGIWRQADTYTSVIAWYDDDGEPDPVVVADDISPRDAAFIAHAPDDIRRTVAALEAVLALCAANTKTDWGDREWGQVSIVSVRRAIETALGGD